MKKSMKYLPSPLAFAVATAAAATTPSFVLAQALEEVVVTAQFREESLQDVPIAITAIGSEELRTSGIDDIMGISMRTPGFTVGSFTPSQPQLYIRGVGSNDDGASGDQSVVVFLDGVYLGRTAGQAFDLFDLERVEVLRGPQGTLYGKNAAGGAINVLSQKPTDEFAAAIEVSGGDLGYKATRAKINGALSKNVVGKLAVSYKERDGYVESLAADIPDLNGYESKAARAQILATPSEQLDLLFTADFSNDDRNGPGRNLGSTYAVEQSVRFNPANPNPGFYENLIDHEPFSSIDTWGVSLKADWSVGNGVLTSITAYRETDVDAVDVAVSAAFEYQNAIPGFAGVATLDNPVSEEDRTFTQEFRFAYDMSDTVFMQTGIYFLNQRTDRIESQIIDNCSLACGSPVDIGAFVPVGSADQKNETNSYGLFAQAIWSVSERVDVTLGGRYTYEEKDASNIGSPNGLGIVEPYNVEMSENWGAFTPKVAVNFNVSEDLSTYASVSTGFKSGGYQGLAPTAVAASTPFNEETVTNTEVGIKGSLLDGAMRFGAAAFVSDYTDLQVLRVVGTNQIIANAGEAEIQGIELEGQWMINEYIQLQGTYAYLDTEYTSLEGDLEQYEGNQLRNAPENAYSVSAIFDYPLADGNVNVRLDYTNKDDAQQDIENRELSLIPGYDILNARIAYGPASGGWEIAAWMKNALDEEYLAHNSVIAPLAELALPAAPRTVGVTLNINFN